MRKTLSPIVLALGLIFAGLTSATTAHAATSTDCVPGQSVDATGCYPTPDCQLAALGLADAQAVISDQRQQLDRRTARVHRQARLIRHLRAELRRERSTHRGDRS